MEGHPGDLAFVPLLLPPDTPAVEASRWWWVRGAEVAATGQPPPDGLAVQFLGMHGLIACWAVDVPDDGPAPADAAYVDLYRLWESVPDAAWAIAGRAVQLVDWARTHRYCGRCGTPTQPMAGERALRCPACRLPAFPRLAPAVIALVHRDDEMLLARGVTFRLPFYSCLAGFVEPGETLEDAVRREVREEVGVEVGPPVYVGSQPWPFPHSLMLGFFAEWRSGEIHIDPNEIVDAQWFGRDALPPVPPGISIARTLIDRWAAVGHR